MPFEFLALILKMTITKVGQLVTSLTIAPRYATVRTSLKIISLRVIQLETIKQLNKILGLQ